MQSSCPSPRKSCPLLPLLVPLLAAALVPPTFAACPVLGPGADAQTKAYLAPFVFHGTLTALARRGPTLRATFRVDRALKGQQQRPDVVVEFALRENPARCRGASLAGVDLSLLQRYIVFAAWRRKKMIAVASPEEYSKRKAVSRVLCNQCGECMQINFLFVSIIHCIFS